MAQTINTNIASLTAQRNLNKSQNSLATAMQRLSSGLRINSAKDDAAGLAIAERMTTQIRGMNQAIRNSNDGISLSQTAEGALEEISNNMQRIRELAVQSRNASNNATDREALNAEVKQRLDEIDRIATQTKFNGTALLDGSFTSKAFQVGADVGQTISIDAIADARALSLGLDGTVGAASTSSTPGTGIDATYTDGDLTINDANITGTTADAKSIADAINTADVGVTASAANAQTLNFVDLSNYDSGEYGYDLKIDGNVVIDTDDDGVSAADVHSAINALSGYSATIDGQAITITKTDGSNFTLQEDMGDDDPNTAITGTGFGIDTAPTDLTPASQEYYGDVALTSTADITVADAGSTGLEDDTATYSDTTALMDVLTAIGADNVINKIDAALSTVSGARANMGAVQSRFESAITSLSVTVENVSAARSRIMDADFAAETAAMTRSQILQQAGVAMVSQANAMPSNVLSLLQ